MADIQNISNFKEEIKSSNLFRLSIIVFIAYTLVFFFVELRSLKSQSFVASFMSTIILASMALITGILTVVPQFSLYVGRTQIGFSILIGISKLIEIIMKNFSIFSVIELLIGFAIFLYGYELVKKFRSYSMAENG